MLPFLVLIVVVVAVFDHSQVVHNMEWCIKADSSQDLPITNDHIRLMASCGNRSWVDCIIFALTPKNNLFCFDFVCCVVV